MDHRLNVKAKSMQKKTQKKKIFDLEVGKDFLDRSTKNPTNRNKN